MTESPDRVVGEVGGTPLPDSVRARVLALAADGLGRMAPEHLPASLKRVASFAPSRRAKLAGTQIAGVLETDEAFREHLATQVTVLAGELAQALLAGKPPLSADPVELAATAYLLRAPGWEEILASVTHEVNAQRVELNAEQHQAEVEQLRRRLADGHEELHQQRTRAKQAADQLRAENSELRHKLGEERRRRRAAEDAAVAAGQELEESTAQAAQRGSTSEAEIRRLRGRVAALEAELASARRVERSSKVSETVRAKILIDTVVEAAQGLRRELGLPATERMPADTVAADFALDGTRTSTGRGSLPVDDPALLEELLQLPRAHLIIDGYNVTKSALPDLSLEKQRERLLAGVAPLVSRTGAEVTVVFDAAETRARPLVTPPRGIRLLYSPYGVIADDVIRDLIAAEPPGRAVVVASSDGEVVRDVLAAGFRTVAAAALSQLVLRPRK